METLEAPPRYIKLTEKPKAPAQKSDEETISEEEECRRDIAINLLERSKANKMIGVQMMPVVMTQCKRCNTLADLPHTFCAVCAAGVPDSHFYLRCNFTRAALRDNETFCEIFQMIVKYMDRGAKDRQHSWLQKARHHAHNPHRCGDWSIMARSDKGARYCNSLLTRVGISAR